MITNSQKKAFSVLAVLLFCKMYAFAQDPVADFSSISTACLNQNIKFTNSSSNAASYIWDFCSNDLSNFNSSQEAVTATDSNVPIGISFVRVQGNWYGFLASRGNSKIFRLNFGNSLENTPTVVDLGIAGISGPENIKLVEEGGVVYGIVVDFLANKIIRLNFTSGIEATPTVQNLGTLGIGQARSLHVVKEGANYVVAVSDFSNGGISLINFGSSITNNPTVGDVTHVLAGSIPGALGLRLLQVGSTWYGFVASYSSNSIKRINFGSALSASASIDQSYTFNSNPTELSVQVEGSNYYLFCASYGGSGVRRLNLGSDLSGTTFTNVGTFGGNFGFDVVRSTPIWYGFAVDLDTEKIHRLKFSGTCSNVSVSSSTAADPGLIAYSAQGTYTVELTAFSGTGKAAVKSGQITVQNLTAPTVSFSNDNVCLTSSITFTATSGSSLNSWNWDFGDGQTSTSSSPVHSYASAGTYAVSLDAGTSNGCGNYVEGNVSIYNAPTANFDLPTNSPLCTNQQFTFTNTSVVDGSPLWEWSVEGAVVSSSLNLLRAFSDPSAQTVKLKATIPGCSDEISQVVGPFDSGPTVLFDAVSDACENETVTFTNLTTGDVTGYLWNFGDSQTSTDTNVSHAYVTAGDYSVSLQGNSSNGCQNTHTAIVSIHSKPQADFSFSPISPYNGSPTQFSDDTATPADGTVNSWLWNFGDASTSTSQDPQHAYENAGTYMVSLRVETTFECADTVEKLITIQQTPTDFTLQPNGCINERIKIENISTGASSFTWDFCFNDLNTLSSSQEAATATDSNVPIGISFVYVQGKWYGFLASRGNGKIFRLDFGNSLENPPNIVDLGISGLSGPENLKLVEEGGVVYGIVVDLSANKIVRLNFTSGIEATPTVQNLGALGIGQARSLHIVKNGLNYVVAVSDFSNGGISLINFGSSITNNPATGDVTHVLPGSIPGALGVRLIQTGGIWYGFVASHSSNSIKRINFGPVLSASATIDQSYAFNEKPTELAVQLEGNNFYLFCASSLGTTGIRRLNLGSDLSGTTFTNIGGFGSNFGFDVVRSAPIWYAFAVDYENKKIHRLKFSGSCPNVSLNSSITSDPGLISYSAAGTYSVELTAYSASLNTDVKKREITIQNLTAPDLSFSNDNICVNSLITFTSYSASPLSSWDWDFGDGQSSTVSSPAHTYAGTGQYKVKLAATASNGCGNYAEESIQLYNSPLAGFDLPSDSPLCTNQLLTFTNQSVIDAGVPVQWEWFNNGTYVSTDENLNYSFASNAVQTVKLKATIPGCSHEVTQTLNSLLTGPEVNFVASGYCEDNLISFDNNTTGNVMSYAWNFGDGVISNEFEPSHTFIDIGSYQVSLQAASSNGCQNNLTKTITIRSRPQPNFSIALPPFSCSGTPTQFSDNTPNPVDSNISSWLWAFNDPESSQNSAAVKNPQHTYKTAGDYSVSLTATTNYGCSNTIQKTVTISQSPVADFTHTPACDDVPVTFDASDGNIATWQWKIGNNTYFYTDKPQYMFTAPGSFPVSLTVTGSNGCFALVQKTVEVPVPFVPDFAVEKNCAGYVAMFTDLTQANADPITSRQWLFGDTGTGSGLAPEFTFTSPGIVPVRLDVTTGSGCVYSVTKNINVVEPPQAYFTATPEVGIPPLIVQFSNASTNATSYRWHFNDASDSTTTGYSAQYTFMENGDYLVDLTATNDQRCSHTYSRIITVAKPVTDATLTSFLLQDNGGGLVNAIVTVKNNGNFTLQNVKLLLQIAGVEIAEVIPGPIAPQATVTYMPAFTIVKSKQLTYVCADIALEDDIDPGDNQWCVSFESEMRVFEPYPNPSRDHISLEWVANEDHEATVRVLDVLGIEMYQTSISSTVGLNQVSLNLDDVKNGIYFLVFTSGDNQRKYRFLVNR